MWRVSDSILSINPKLRCINFQQAEARLLVGKEILIIIAGAVDYDRCGEHRVPDAREIVTAVIIGRNV